MNADELNNLADRYEAMISELSIEDDSTKRWLNVAAALHLAATMKGFAELPSPVLWKNTHEGVTWSAVPDSVTHERVTAPTLIEAMRAAIDAANPPKHEHDYEMQYVCEDCGDRKALSSKRTGRCECLWEDCHNR